MDLYDEIESLDNKSAQNTESNFSFDMSKEEQDSFLSNIAQETSKLSSDRKNELFELFVQKSGILNNSSENKYLKNPIFGMRFLSQFFASSDKESDIEKLYQEFDDFVMNDFAKMSNEIAIKNQAELYDRALTIKEELYEDIRFVELANKSVIGIGGSFSAGKSSFLNSILNSKEDILPVDIIPTTAIPTYVVTSDKNAIYTFNQYGDKAWIDEEGFLAISHEFNTIYSFGLSSIIKNIVVYSEDMPYQNIAFLDTPGYSKPDGYSQTDKKIAKEYLENVGALIWLIDSDNGDIRETDIDFLNELEIKESVNVLFVINKADKKPQSELKQILESAKESLTKNFKRKFSITAYSSHDKKEYFGEDKIKRFLEVADKTTVRSDLYERFSNVFDLYEAHLTEVKENSKRLLGVFNRLDVIGNSIVSEIDGYEYLEKSVKDRVTENKRETELYEEVRKKGLALLYKILDNLGVRVDTSQIKEEQKEKDILESAALIIMRGFENIELEGHRSYRGSEKVYAGEWKDGNYHGRGIMTYDNGKYDGEWKDGNKHGRGVETYSNGAKYDGEWKGHQRNGRGTYYSAYGDKYNGEWKDGDRHGLGVMIYADGTKYDGEWKDDSFQCGRKVKTYSNGDKYDGEWKGHQRNGRGTYYSAYGDKYDGEWKDDKHNGRGIYYWANGDKYDGEWKDGSRNGRGIYYWVNGDKYDGEWKDDKRNGRGIYYWANGDKYDGEWKDGVRIR